MKNATMPIAAVLALGAALSMPVALAQSAITPEVRAAEDAAVESAAAAGHAQDGATQAQAAPQPQAATTDGQAAGRKLGWNDVDADGNGTVSREESAVLPALAAVFDGADADGDGELTADEYRSHAAKTGGQD